MLNPAPLHTNHPSLDDIFSEQGLLAQKLDNFEFRKGQTAMASAIADALQAGKELDRTANMLAVEAGTGIGKTLGYLIPAALSNRKLIISTGTKNLQDQILDKEIPFIKEHILPSLNAICVKGRQNYLCLYRWQQFIAAPSLPHMADNDYLSLLHEWATETKTGDRAELSWLADDAPLWHHISATNTQCLGTLCPDHSTCFLTQLRIKAAKANLLIVNHHLFFSDLALRRFGKAEVLPRYEAVLFDEAHHLENVATQYFGINFSHYQVIDLVQDTESSAQKELSAKKSKPLIQLARALARQADVFAAIFPKERGRFPLQKFIDNSPSWDTELESLQQRLTGLAQQLEELSIAGEIWIGLHRRCLIMQDTLFSITRDMDSSHVYWYERREKTVALSASPIEVAPDLNEHLYSQVHSAIFTSATLATGGNYSYFKDRLGLPDDMATLSIPTPFDYQNRTLLYVPDNSFPAPDQAHYFSAMQETLLDMLLASQGRALILCTSFKSMHNLYVYLHERLPFPVLVQGSAPKAVLLETFQQDTHSVLLAVASFWEGVDVPGDTLSCVVIDKLPFEVPSDPVIMARIQKIKDDGGNPFFDFQVPRAVLTLRQGVGRLMRSSRDTGVIAIMDVRLFTKRYGSTFLKSLPNSPVTRSLDQVKLFFSEETIL